MIDFDAHQRILAHHPHLQAVGRLDQQRLPVIGVHDRDDIGAAFGVATESGDDFRAKKILNLGGRERTQHAPNHCKQGTTFASLKGIYSPRGQRSAGFPAHEA